MNSQSHLDNAMIQQLLDLGGKDLLGKMIGLFLEHAPLRMDKIEAAYVSQDLDEVYREAHALKSSAANLGANELRFLCQDIELLAHDGKASELVPKMPELVRLFHLVKDELAQKKVDLEA